MRLLERLFASRPRLVSLTDWALPVVIVLALVAGSPFILRPGLPRETDAELHVYRAAELRYALGEGAIYTRWAPNFYYGYGYPIFNYYAPLGYYLANLAALAPGAGIVGGVRIVFVLGFLLAGVGAYLLGRELLGPESGVITAACYLLAPYVLFVDPHARGNLAEHLALCLLPAVFYSYHRVLNGRGRRMAFGAAALGMAALVLAHNLMGLVSAALVCAYVLWQGIAGRRPAVGWGALALVFAACVSAFFWVPALAERQAVKLEVIGPGHFDFHEHFLSLGELLAASMRLDLGSAAPRFWLNLGVGQWVLGLLGTAAALYCRKRRPDMLFFVLTGVGLGILMLPASTPVWELVPGMEYLQFPWRLLGPASLMLAVAAGGAVQALADRRWRLLGSAAALLALLLLALPLLYPPEWDAEFGGTRPVDYLEWERGSLALGTTSTGDYVPVTAALEPVGPEPSLIESYSSPGPVDKLDRSRLPEGAAAEVIEHGPLHDQFLVNSPDGVTLRVYTFHFPGWNAYVDDEEVQIEVTDPEGFISLWVPPGEHEVAVAFEDTPVRKGGWLLSAAGAVGLACLVLAMPRLRGRAEPCVPRRLDRAPALVAIGAILVFTAVKVGVIDQHDWLRYRSAPGEARPAEHSVSAVFGGEIELLGYDLPGSQVHAGDALSVILYWRALTDVGRNYQSFVHMTPRPQAGAALGSPTAQDDHLNPGGYPTDRWGTELYVWDEYELDLPQDLPAGDYVLSAGLYLLEEGTRLAVRDAAGNALGDSYVFATVSVVR
jgi:hypothetical protein